MSLLRKFGKRSKRIDGEIAKKTEPTDHRKEDKKPDQREELNRREHKQKANDKTVHQANKEKANDKTARPENREKADEKPDYVEEPKYCEEEVFQKEDRKPDEIEQVVMNKLDEIEKMKCEEDETKPEEKSDPSVDHKSSDEMNSKMDKEPEEQKLDLTDKQSSEDKTDRKEDMNPKENQMKSKEDTQSDETQIDSKKDKIKKAEDKKTDETKMDTKDNGNPDETKQDSKEDKTPDEKIDQKTDKTPDKNEIDVKNDQKTLTLDDKKSDLIKCGICSGLVQESKSLPCLHSFCSACIQVYSQNQSDHIRCPVCKETSTLPPDGVEGLRGNFFITRMKKIHELKTDLANKTISCTCCDVTENIAIAWCLDCVEHYLCSGCVQTHKTFKPLQSHLVHLFKDLESGKVDIEKIPFKEYCSTHEGQTLWFYCETCGMLICRDCSVLDHPSYIHTLVKVEQISGARGEKLEELSSECEKVAEQINHALKRVDDVDDDLIKALESAQTEVKHNAEKIKDSFLTNLKKKEHQLLHKVEEVGKEHKSLITLDREALQSQQLQLERALAVSTHISNKGSPYDLAAMYLTLTDTLERLATIKPNIIDKSLSQMNFEPNLLVHVEAPKLGIVTDEHKLRPQHDITGRWVAEGQICQKSGLQNAINMATLPTGEIIVVDHNDPKLKLFTTDGELKDSINVKLDLASNPQPSSAVISPSGFIFVTDESQFVQVFDLAGKLTNRFKTVPPENAQTQESKPSSLAGMAMNCSDQLVVGDSAGEYISIHKQSGDHVRSFKVTIKPWFISAAPSKDIIIVSNCGGHCTQILTSSGQVLHTLSSAPVGGKAWKPTGACFTSDEEYLLASQGDWGKPGGIYHYLYSTDGNYMLYLGCVTDDVSNPTDVVVAEDGKLLVLEHTHIKVFKKK